MMVWNNKLHGPFNTNTTETNDGSHFSQSSIQYVY